jgi:hypothetical protein
VVLCSHTDQKHGSNKIDQQSLMFYAAKLTAKLGATRLSRATNS